MNKNIKANLNITLEVNSKGEERLLIEKEGELKDFATIATMFKELISNEEQKLFAKQILSLMSTIVKYAREEE